MFITKPGGKIMFKKTLAAVLALVMCVATFSMLAIPTSAATPTIENLYEFDRYGTPNLETVDGEPSSNHLYALSKNIKVAAGDKIYVGPAVTTQGYQLTSYKADGTVSTKQVKIGDGNLVVSEVISDSVTEGKGDIAILCYTVPEGVTDIRWAASQIFTDCAVITKNAAFTAEDYVSYWTAKGVNIEAYIGGRDYTVAADEIQNVFANGGVHSGSHGSSGSNTSGNYFSTKELIKVKEGDMLYFTATNDQGWTLCLYKEDGSYNTVVKDPYLVPYDTLENGVMIYAYRVTSTSAYVRHNAYKTVHNAGLSVLTVNQPFTGGTLTKWAVDNGGDKAAIEALIGVHEYVPPVEPEVPTPPTSDAAIAVISILGMISLAGVVVVGKKAKNN